MTNTLNLAATMHAMAIANGALEPTTLPAPTPKNDEILVKTAYIGINRADLMQIEGKYDQPNGASPLPGLEISGFVAKIGPNTTDLALNTPMCALIEGGGYAEYVTVPATQALPLPAGIDLQAAATLPEAAATSIMALHQVGRLQRGERVLIHGGASGLGILMTQIAKHCFGAEVLSTVGNDEKAALLQKLGIVVLNHRAAPFAQAMEPVDLIIDTLGGPQLETHLRLLKPGGRLVTLAMLEGSAVPDGFKITRLLMNHLTWSGTTLRSRSAAEKAEIMRLVAQHVWPKLADGSIQPVIDSIFPLADAKKAHVRMQERLHMGKILLEVAPK